MLVSQFFCEIFLFKFIIPNLISYIWEKLKQILLKIFSNYLFFITLFLLFSCNPPKENYIETISFYKDFTEKITANQLNEISFLDLKSNALETNDAIYWFKLQLKEEALNENVVIQLKEAYLKELEIYDSQLQKTQDFNDYNTATFYINVTEHKNVLFAKIKFDRNPYIIINAFNKKNIPQIKKGDEFRATGYYLFVILFLILNLILAYFFKNTIFIWYVIFQASINIIIALYDNTLTGLITNTKILNTIIGINYLIIPISAIIFCVKLLKVETFYPKLIRFLKLLCIPLIILNIMFHITHNFEILAYQDLYSSIFYIITLLLGFLLIKKNIYAKYYVIGYSILFAVGILYSIVINFGLTYIPVDMDILKFGVITEIAMLTFASILKAKEVLAENELIKTQLVDQQENINNLKRENKNVQMLSDEKLIKITDKYEFTKREKEVFVLILKSLNNQQIADKLFISVSTVKYHSKNIYEKLNVKKRSELIEKILLKV